MVLFLCNNGGYNVLEMIWPTRWANICVTHFIDLMVGALHYKPSSSLWLICLFMESHLGHKSRLWLEVKYQQRYWPDFKIKAIHVACARNYFVYLV